MIQRVQIRNYRSLAEVDVNLGPVTVLAGRNGSGKSNFVDALRFLSDAVNLGLEAAVMKRKGIGALRRWSKGRPRDVMIAVEGRLPAPSVSYEYTIELGSQRGGGFRVKREAFKGTGGGDRNAEYEVSDGKVVHIEGKGTVRLDEALISSTALLLTTPLVGSAWTVGRHLSRLSFCSILPNEVREPQKLAQEYPLAEHGENLASLLWDLKERKPQVLKEISAALSVAVEGLLGIDVQQAGIGGGGGYLLLTFDHELAGGGTCTFDASQESDGTLRMLGLLTALYQVPSPSFLAIEEPELHIHPGALGVLSDVVREAAQARGTQVLLTTHSPDLLSRFGADELRAVEVIDGSTHIGLIDSAQRAAIEQDLFSGGDLLRIEGLYTDRGGVQS
ncbi:AAA family ATPase [bacterium]|nr:AAA family ATPase [bacterium]